MRDVQEENGIVAKLCGRLSLSSTWKPQCFDERDAVLLQALTKRASSASRHRRRWRHTSLPSVTFACSFHIDFIVASYISPILIKARIFCMAARAKNKLRPVLSRPCRVSWEGVSSWSSRCQRRLWRGVRYYYISREARRSSKQIGNLYSAKATCWDDGAQAVIRHVNAHLRGPQQCHVRPLVLTSTGWRQTCSSKNHCCVCNDHSSQVFYDRCVWSLF